MRSLTGLSPCQFLGHSAGTGCTSQWESWCTLDALQLCCLDVWIFVQSLLVLTFIVSLKPQYTRDRIAAHYLIINVEPPQARIYQMLFFFLSYKRGWLCSKFYFMGIKHEARIVTRNTPRWNSYCVCIIKLYKPAPWPGFIILALQWIETRCRQRGYLQVVL